MTIPILPYRKFVLIYLVLFITLMGIIMQLGITYFLGFYGKSIFIDSVVSNVILAILSIAVLNNIKYYKPTKERYLYLVLLSSTVSIIWILILKWVLYNIFPKDLVYQSFIQSSFSIRFCYAFIIIGFIAIISWILLGVKDQKEQENRKKDTEKLAKDAELLKLRQQLQPHFLFNSLNSISALAGSQPVEARIMIQQLSDFLRGTLKNDESQLITITEEIKYIELYLNIEKVRFGHRLFTEIIIKENTLNLHLPSLLLQPIVENAIKFGLYDTTENVTIMIQTTLENEELIICVQNPFETETIQKKGTGFGLSSIHRRLYLLYGRSDLLQTKIENNLFITTLKIPQL